MPLAWFEERLPYREAEELVTILCSRRLLVSLHLAELFQTDYIVPGLGHVADLFALELHDLDVVRLHFLSRRRHRLTIVSMNASEYGVCRHVVAILVHAERTHLVAAVGHGREQTLHPLRVGLNGSTPASESAWAENVACGWQYC